MRKWRSIGIFLIVIIALAACSKKETPEDRLTTYVELWNNAEFKKMYGEYVSEASKEAFGSTEYIDRTTKLYKDLSITDVKVVFTKPDGDKEYKSEEQPEFPVHITMETLAGPVEFEKKVMMTYGKSGEDENWFVEWDPSFILPDLTLSDKVGISTITSKRGEIFDRNGLPLAINGKGYEAGIVPEKFNEERDAEKLATVLSTTPEFINKQLNQSWVKADQFVPIKKVASSQEIIIEKMIEVPGVTYTQVEMREYPYGEPLSHLTGYISRINADELEKVKDQGYVETDFIGKRGLEQLLEKQLRGQDGSRIYIEKTAQGAERITIAEKTATDGDSITLTIDAKLQQKTFNAMNGEAGTAAAVDPKTGETLVLTSSPAFDPNELMIGVSAIRYEELTEDPLQPLLNRFAATYAPGSAIKPITASIGLEAGTIDPSKGYTIEGKRWKKDESWGNFGVTRVYTPPNPIDLKKAIAYSDNIYFAMEAIGMGKDTLIEGLKKFGFGEDIPFSYPVRTSQISNDGTIGTEAQLVDTSYGQGQMLMNIAHLASSYAPIINDGKMFKPVLFEDEPKSEIWKEGLTSPENAAILRANLREVVVNGSAKDANIPSVKLSGKTGTTELKSSQEKGGKENGFFVGYQTDETSYILAMMIESIEDNGGSSHVVKMVAEVMGN
ncbi:penicillin-binding transpeptidase domain-containing protein [Sporosarcina sp. ANT_H38]|uniref:penicillin-binding transpeptidase domain-containing protein n=1 Tax=Sporosarcina sp. ANT_H38 TaxID=2597358 RepID=UPI0011F26694|nr:penicillin-binding transpeptidase domain-containing protein [Sporosarcina sp. ANT_H38]KAA0964890.1 penicillin-binding transpeptidase domain-containing protein [Sporosarcina sp. ANT_H38]